MRNLPPEPEPHCLMASRPEARPRPLRPGDMEERAGAMETPDAYLSTNEWAARKEVMEWQRNS